MMWRLTTWLAARPRATKNGIAPIDGCICLLLALLPILVNLPGVLRGQTLFLRDINFHLQPLTTYWNASLHRADFPIWNPLLGAGMPLAASMELPFYYPPLIVFYYLAYDRALCAFLAIHEIILALGTFALCRRWGWRPAGAFISALTLVLSGPVLSLHNVYQYVPAVALLPLVLALFLRTWDRPCLRCGLLLALTFSIQTATARPDISLMAGLLLLVLTIHRAAQTGYSGTGLARRILLVWAPLAAAMLSLGLPILWPTIEMIPWSNRQMGVDLGESMAISLSPPQLLTLLLPHLFRGGLDYGAQHAELSLAIKYRPYLLTIYLGILPLLLGFIGMRHRRAPARLLAFLAALTLLLALGGWTPIYGWFYHLVPLVSYTRFPVKYFVLTTFCWSLLAGCGWDHLQRRAGSPGQWVVWATTILPVYAVVGYCLAHPLGTQEWVSLLYRIWVENRWPQASWRLPAVFGEVWDLVTQDLSGVVIFWTCSVAVISLSLRGRWSPHTGTGVAAALLVADLISNNQGFDDHLDRRVFLDTPPLARSVVAGPHSARLYYPLGMATYPVSLLREGTATGPSYLRENLIERRLLLFNVPSAYGLSHCDIYGNMILDSPAAIISRLRGMAGGLPAPREMEIAGLYNGGTVIIPLGGAAATLVGEARARGPHYGLDLLSVLPSERVAIYRNPRARGWAYFVPDARILDTPGAVLQALASQAQDLRHTVLLLGDAPLREMITLRKTLRHRAQIAGQPGCSQVERTATRVSILCRQPVSGFLVQPDVRYPGWEVRVDERIQPLLQAYGLARSVYLEAGQHQVEFRYRPVWFPWAWGLALAGLAAGIRLAFWTRP